MKIKELMKHLSYYDENLEVEIIAHVSEFDITSGILTATPDKMFQVGGELAIHVVEVEEDDTLITYPENES